jgi:hypothetical protein
MRQIMILVSLIGCLVSVSRAQSPVGAWQAVKDLSPGTALTLSVRHLRYSEAHCVFLTADDNGLVCEHRWKTLIAVPPRELRYSRDQVREVRVEHSDDLNAKAGAIIAGGVGAALGAALPGRPEERLGGALLLGGIGGLGGYIFGRDFHPLHGKLIYKAPKR